MENIPENNFFELTLSQQGAGWLLRLARISRWLIIMAIFLCLLGSVNIIMRYTIYMRYNPGTWWGIIEMRILPVFEGGALIVTVIQLYYYFIFARMCREAIVKQQPELFNNAFKWLLKNTLTACIMFILQFMIMGFVMYSEFVVLSR